MHDRTPAPLSIGEAVEALRRMHPDVTRSSLRFLEREGLLAPARTSGGHRLYGLDDLDRVRTIKVWQAQRFPLEDIRQRLRRFDGLGDLRGLATVVLEALATEDASARRLVLEADASGVPLARLFQEVLTPALIAVGHRWRDGDMRVGQEHVATELARELILELQGRHQHPSPAGPPVLAACVEGERHDLGLRMLVALLRAEGRLVHYLGADIPATILGEEVRERRPDVVLLSASAPERLEAARWAAEAMADAARGTPLRIVLGGQGVRGQEDEVATWGIEPAADDLAATVRSVLHPHPPSPFHRGCRADTGRSHRPDEGWRQSFCSSADPQPGSV